MALFLQLDRKSGDEIMKINTNLLIGLVAMLVATVFLTVDFLAIPLTGFEPTMVLRFCLVAIVAIFGWWQISIYWRGRS